MTREKTRDWEAFWEVAALIASAVIVYGGLFVIFMAEQEATR